MVLVPACLVVIAALMIALFWAMHRFRRNLVQGDGSGPDRTEHIDATAHSRADHKAGHFGVWKGIPFGNR